MKRYAGITIGPIFDTISDAASPAALWFASTFFSDITRRLCKEIKAAGFSIISPYFDEDDADGLKDGIGKYHDRIFFAVENMEASKMHAWLKEIIKAVKMAAAENFYEQKQEGEKWDLQVENAAAFLESYLQIHYIIAEKGQLNGNNCILALSPYLDALELMKSFPASNEGNPFRELTFGRSDGTARIMKSRLYSSVDSDKMKVGGGRSRNLKEIAQGGSGEPSLRKDRKYPNYYAVVFADADGMGKFLESMSDEMVTEFSKRCLDYDKAAADAIHAYGGMTIYAGGDDLLFLAPMMHGDKNIFGLCGELSNLFYGKLKDGTHCKEGLIPTMSFGVSAQYYKYPLYEALKRAWECLDRAKKEAFKDPDAGAMAEKKKDCICFHLEKHSGQGADLLIGNEALKVYGELLKKMLERGETDKGADEKMVKNLGAKLQEFYEIICVMDAKWDRRGECPSWENLFDNKRQAQWEEFRKYIENWYYEYMAKGHSRIFTVHDSSRNLEERRFCSLLATLRIGKFFLEKNDEN